MSALIVDDFIPQLSIDCVIFGYQESALKVLVPKFDTSVALWSLPGGFVKQSESIDTAARRVLHERTGLDNIYLEQFRVFGDAHRAKNELFTDTLGTVTQELVGRGIVLQDSLEWLSRRFVSIGYYALVDINKVNPCQTAFDTSIEWYNIKSLPQMIIDHNDIVTYALQSLRQTFDQKLIGFNLLPETFTMREVQELYEAVYDKPFARNNFQKKILDLGVLERLEKRFTGAANKAPYLYRFKN